MNPGNVAKIDHLMGPARDCGQGQAPGRRYVLCSTPRCGSNLVSDMLQQTGRAGDPMEYLNPRYIAGHLRREGLLPDTALDLGAYLETIERRRSTANGVFGLKAHFEHLQSHARAKTLEPRAFLRGYDRIVLLRRRDKIAQAVSLYKARVTQIWSSQDRDFLPPEDERLHRKPGFDPAGIAQALAAVVAQDEGWVRLLKAARLDYREVWYEDVVADFETESRGLVAWLGLAGDGLAIAPPRLERQSVGADPMVAAFAALIGAGRAGAGAVAR